MVDLEKINQLIENLISTFGDKLYSVIVLKRNKEVVTRKHNNNLDDEHIKEITNFLTSGMLSYYINHENQDHGNFSFQASLFNVIISNAGTDAVLIFFTSLEESTNYFFPYVYLSAEKIARINLGRNVSYVIPILHGTFANDDIISEPHRFTMGEKGKYVLKVILGGDSGVGKTTLVEQFIHNKFGRDYKSTLGINIMTKKVDFPEWKCNIEYSIYDLGGQAVYKVVRKGYYLGANIGFLVFDVTNRESFKNIKNWYDEITAVEPNSFLTLIGNKIDLEEKREISSDEAMNMAKKLNLQYLETSALNKDIVDEAFKTLGFSFILKNNTFKRDKVKIKSGWVF